MQNKTVRTVIKYYYSLHSTVTFTYYIKVIISTKKPVLKMLIINRPQLLVMSLTYSTL